MQRPAATVASAGLWLSHFRVVALQVLKMSILRVAFMLKGVGLSQKRGFFPIGARFSGFHPVLRRREAWSVELFIVASDGKQ
jgi:hypothetical protein